MEIDLKYCSSSYLMFRTICDKNKAFTDKYPPRLYTRPSSLIKVKDSDDLYHALKKEVDKACLTGKTAIALSGGIDSAILAKFMPKGSMAYTFRCVVPGKKVTDETSTAALYAKECGLQHRIIEMYWEDFEKYAPILMKHKGAPIHSIEVQIYKAALQAKADGFDNIIFGETADTNYGGMSGLLSKDWTFGEFVNRYSYVLPYYVLKDSELVLKPYKDYVNQGIVDCHNFQRNVFLCESMGSYTNACETAGINLVAPYALTYWDSDVDYVRIRNGENKYLVRDVFNKLYQNFAIPPKLPMPRAVNEWFANWEGPKRKEFWENCITPLNGDQRWLVWCLEKFLDLIEK